MALITVAEAKSDWLDMSDSTLDDTIGRWIDQAEAVVKKHCLQPIDQESVEREFKLADLRRDELGTYYRLGYTVPIALTSLSYRSSVTDSWTTITDTSNAVIDEGKLYYTSYQYTQYKAVVAVGYTSPPADVKTAVALLVVEAYKQSKVGNNAIAVSQVQTSQGSGTGTTTTTVYIKSVTPQVEALLAPYRVVWL